jgi:hypothetical protein
VKVKLLIGALIFLIVLNLATIGSFVYTQWKRGREHAAWAPTPPDLQRSGRSTGDTVRSRRHAGFGHEERAELWRLLSEFMEETAELRSKTTDLEEQVFDRMRRDPVPRAELDSLLAEIASVRLEITRRATDKLIEARAHISPEQLEHFYERILGSRSDGRRMGYRHRFGGPGNRGKTERRYRGESF